MNNMLTKNCKIKCENADEIWAFEVLLVSLQNLQAVGLGYSCLGAFKRISSILAKLFNAQLM